MRERIDWISQLEAEIQDLKSQRSEALQRITVTESEKENVAVQSLRNRTQAGQARKIAVVAEQHAIVDKAYLEAQYARAKANEEEVSSSGTVLTSAMRIISASQRIFLSAQYFCAFFFLTCALVHGFQFWSLLLHCVWFLPRLW